MRHQGLIDTAQHPEKYFTWFFPGRLSPKPFNACIQQAFFLQRHARALYSWMAGSPQSRRL